MKIRLTCDRAGYGWFQATGEVVELPKHEARSLIEAGQAEAVHRDTPLGLPSEGDQQQ